MIARIRFVSDYSNSVNCVSKQDLDKLIDFVGEQVKATQMKIDDDGSVTTVQYKDTFDLNKAGGEDGYKLVTPADRYKINDDKNFIVDIELLTKEFPNLEFSIKGLPKGIGADYTNLLETMKMIGDKIEDATNRFDKTIEFNERCEVHVPNLGLMSINKVAYATDYCTEELQNLLKKGWRIIAVCPQPDQRRPDYILGMSVTELHGDVEVEHFAGSGIE